MRFCKFILHFCKSNVRSLNILNRTISVAFIYQYSQHFSAHLMLIGMIIAKPIRVNEKCQGSPNDC